MILVYYHLNIIKTNTKHIQEQFKFFRLSLQCRWNDNQKNLEKKILTKAIPPPPSKTAPQPLPPARPLLLKPNPIQPPPHTFPGKHRSPVKTNYLRSSSVQMNLLAEFVLTDNPSVCINAAQDELYFVYIYLYSAKFSK